MSSEPSKSRKRKLAETSSSGPLVFPLSRPGQKKKSTSSATSSTVSTLARSTSALKRRRTNPNQSSISPDRSSAKRTASRMSFGLKSGSQSIGRPKVKKTGSHSKISRPKSGAKKSLKIASFKEKPKVSASFERDSVTLMISAIRAIFNATKCEASHEELYATCQSLCGLSKYKLLFDELCLVIDAHSGDLVTQFLDRSDSQLSADTAASSSVKSNSSVWFVQRLSQLWQRFWREMQLVSQLCLCLDKSYVCSEETSHESLFRLSVGLFSRHLLSKHRDSLVISDILNVLELIRQISSDDSSSLLYSELVNNLSVSVSVIFEIGLFDHLELALIHHTAVYYHRLSEGHLSGHSGSAIISYIDLVSRSLQLERYHSRIIFGRYTGGRTLNAMLSALQSEMIQKRATDLLAGRLGFPSLIEHRESVSYLSTVFDLYSSVNELSVLKDAFVSYIVEQGRNILSQCVSNTSEQKEELEEKEARPSSSAATAAPIALSSQPEEIVVSALIDLKRHLTHCLTEALDSTFSFAMRKAFEKFVNESKNADLLSEYLAIFADHRLRKVGGVRRGMSERELESVLDEVMAIVSFVHGKDIFEAFYKSLLARRLILENSANESLEYSMIFRCKKEFGKGYANELEKLFLDLQRSKELIDKYKLYCVNYDKRCDHLLQKCEFDVTVLTSGLWPSMKSSSLDSSSSSMSGSVSSGMTSRLRSTADDSSSVLRAKKVDKEEIEMIGSSIVNELMKSFSTFYRNEHSGRIVRFINSMSTCLIRGHFPKGKREIMMSGRQACVLILFNERNKWSLKDLSERLNQCDQHALKCVLSSLVQSRLLLSRNTSSESSDPLSMEYKLNGSYTQRSLRIQINQEQMKQSKSERSETMEKTLFSRQYAMDAAIVRIMKARKRLNHNELIVECIKQLRFDTDGTALKKRIAHLIENEYLERDSEDHRVYHYKA